MSQRRKALAAANARGVKLGNPLLRASLHQERMAAAAKSARAMARTADLRPVIAEVSQGRRRRHADRDRQGP